MIFKNQMQRHKLRERSYEKRIMVCKRTQIERTVREKSQFVAGEVLVKGSQSENTLVIRKQGKREKKGNKKCSCI